MWEFLHSLQHTKTNRPAIVQSCVVLYRTKGFGDFKMKLNIALHFKTSSAERKICLPSKIWV